MSQDGICTTIQLAAAFELYWPYFAYCCALTLLFVKVLWRTPSGIGALDQFIMETRALLARALWRMAFKAIWVWLVGGSILLSVGAWLCSKGGS